MTETRPRLSRLEVSPRRGEEAYRAADRHGQFIRILRWAVPAVVVIGAGGFAAALYFSPQPETPVSLSKLDLTNNSLVMDAPRVSGFTNARRSYEVSAEKATQNLQSPNVVALEKIDATLGLEGDSKAKIGAAAGVYDSQAETLQLKDGIKIETSAGYEAKLNQADVNLRDNTMRSSQPVEIKLADGVIHGGSVEITDGGKRIQMNNGVSMTFGGTTGAGAGQTSTPQGSP